MNLKRMIHLDTRDQKRENARDRSKRYTQIADDLLRDGMEEIVFARLEGDAPAKLAMDCESIDFEALPSWEIALLHDMDQGEVERIQSDLAVKRLRERLMDEEDYPYPTDAEIEQARAEMREEEANALDYQDEPDLPEGDVIWPPAPYYGIDHIEESHLWRERGFIITNTPWGAKR